MCKKILKLTLDRKWREEGKKRRQYSAASLLNQIKWYKKITHARTHTQKHFLPSEFLLELYAITSVCDCGILN